MKEALEPWLSETTRIRGVLACGVRCPDETVVIPASPSGFPRKNLEYSLRCMADAFQVLKLNRLPNDYIRWIYQNALVYCRKRPDGVFLAIFTGREAEGVDFEKVRTALEDFLTLQ